MIGVMNRRATVFLFAGIIALIPAVLSAQAVELRRGFRSLELGLSFEEAQAVLRSDSAFSYRGEPDLSLSLSESSAVIDTAGRGYIKRALLQFNGDRLTILTLYLDQTTFDFFQLMEQLTDRYGPEKDMNPEWVVWEDARTRILLERPLTIRYLDLADLAERRSSGAVETSIQEEARERFLEEF